MNRKEIEALSYQELIEALKEEWNEEWGPFFYGDEIDDLSFFLVNNELSFMYGELDECHYSNKHCAVVWKSPGLPNDFSKRMFTARTPHEALIRAILLTLWEGRGK